MWGAIAGAALSLGSSIFGGMKAAKAERRARRERQQREREEQAWYDRRYNEDYLDTAAGQNLIRQANDYADKQWRKAEGAKAVGGGTDAATAMAKESANKMVGNAVANIAASDTARKDSVDSQHQRNLDNFSEQRQAEYQNKANNITAAASQMSSAMMSAGAALDSGSTTKTKLQTQAPSGSEMVDYTKNYESKINPASNATNTNEVKTALGNFPREKVYKRVGVGGNNEWFWDGLK